MLNVNLFRGKFYGISGGGGATGLGTFFEFDPQSEDFDRVISFDGTNGALPTVDLKVIWL